jgi:hypothetical protein
MYLTQVLHQFPIYSRCKYSPPQTYTSTYYVHSRVHDIFVQLLAGWLVKSRPVLTHFVYVNACVPNADMQAGLHNLRARTHYTFMVGAIAVYIVLPQSFSRCGSFLSPHTFVSGACACYMKKNTPWESTAEKVFSYKAIFIYVKKGCGKTLFAMYETLLQLHHTAISVIAIYAFVALVNNCSMFSNRCSNYADRMRYAYFILIY